MTNALRQKKTRREKRKDAGVVIRAPRITEKSVHMGERGTYVFDVAVNANKKEVVRAVEELFKVRPVSVRMVRSPGKRSWTRGTNRFGRSAERKKAYVHLKKGDVIDLA